MSWWKILLIVIAAVTVGVPLIFFAVKTYVKEIREWRKQKKNLEEKLPDVEISEEQAREQATKEFFVAFRPYFDYIEKGEIDKANKFLSDFYANCSHKTIACGNTVKCIECPYGGLVSMNILK